MHAHIAAAAAAAAHGAAQAAAHGFTEDTDTDDAAEDARAREARGAGETAMACDVAPGPKAKVHAEIAGPAPAIITVAVAVRGVSAVRRSPVRGSQAAAVRGPDAATSGSRS